MCNHRPIEVLVDCGADVNIQHRRNGLTPLQVACSADKLDIETVRTFLNKGTVAGYTQCIYEYKQNILTVTYYNI